MQAVKDAFAVKRQAEEAASKAQDSFATVVAAELNAGTSPFFIAAELGVSYEVIRRIARKKGVKDLRQAAD